MISHEWLASLTDRERAVIGECLRAAAEGPFFDDAEFGALFGLERGEVERVAARWPDVGPGDETARLAVNNALVNLAGYPHGREREWARWISADAGEVTAIAERLRLAIS